MATAWNSSGNLDITGGNVTVENNITYVTPETIGIVDKSIGSFTGARTITRPDTIVEIKGFKQSQDTN